MTSSEMISIKVTPYGKPSFMIRVSADARVADLRTAISQVPSKPMGLGNYVIIREGRYLSDDSALLKSIPLTTGDEVVLLMGRSLPTPSPSTPASTPTIPVTSNDSTDSQSRTSDTAVTSTKTRSQEDVVMSSPAPASASSTPMPKSPESAAAPQPAVVIPPPPPAPQPAIVTPPPASVTPLPAYVAPPPASIAPPPLQHTMLDVNGKADWVIQHIDKICSERGTRARMRALDNHQLAKAYFKSYDSPDDCEEARLVLLEVLRISQPQAPSSPPPPAAAAAGASAPHPAASHPLAATVPHPSSHSPPPASAAAAASTHYHSSLHSTHYQPPRVIHVRDDPSLPNTKRSNTQQQKTVASPTSTLHAFINERFNSPALAQSVIEKLKTYGIDEQDPRWRQSLSSFARDETLWSELKLPAALSARLRSDLQSSSPPQLHFAAASTNLSSGSQRATLAPSNSCPTCKMDDSWLEHNISCSKLWANLVVREQATFLADATARPLAEVMLVARQYPLDQDDNAARAFSALQNGVHLETWRKKFDGGESRAPHPGNGRSAQQQRPQQQEQQRVQPKRECPVCTTDVPLDKTYTVNCPSNPAHQICLDCMARAIKGLVSEKRALSCPLCPQKNAWIIHADEAQGLAAQLGPQRLQEAIGSSSSKALLSYADEISTQLALAAMKDGVKCPTPNCKCYVVLHDPAERANCICNGCRKGFCSHCRGPPHYRATCAEVQQHRSAWLQWRTERGPAYRAQQEHLRKQAEEFPKERARIAEENKVLLQAYRTLEADERQFESTCKVCPGCGRRIEKIAGCDAMACGRDYHGNVQMGGCGRTFAWSAAQPYKSSLPPLKQLEEVKPPPPPNNTQHPPEILCDGCHKSIVGLRFSCIHCPEFNYCESCDALGRAPDGSIHPKEHVFRIVEKIE